MRMLLLPLFILLHLRESKAQITTLPFPRNFEKSYEKGLRNWDGSPGVHYWQNRAEYKIDVSLDPKEREVEGSQEVTYLNNSPDTLHILRLKLLHDLYRKGGQRADDIDPKDVTEGVTIERLSINGLTVDKAAQKRYDTYLDIRLKTPLAPHSSLKLFTSWAFTMPASKNATRECVCDPTTFFIPYFYPEIAVYDDLHGWASAPYNGLQEFYHDFSDYEVSITLPKGYQAWATGEWQNASDILRPKFLERWQRAHASTEVMSIFSEAELKAGNVFKKAKKNVFHFKAKQVPDFTFAASAHYNWDATAVIVDEKFGRLAFVSAAYDSGSNDFKRVARIAADGLHLMSTWLPGYPYPYPALTVFNGNDGMEYPMMINDASVPNEYVTSLTLHESAHTYFPFMMGINEQDHAWMDEGWASFFEHFLTDSLENKKSNVGGSWGFGNDWEVPPMVPSRALDGRSYGFAAYTRPQLAYTQLYDLLGYELFQECLKVFMDRWKGKHPGPYEFFNTFNHVSGQNLDWFWKPWFFEFGYPDLNLCVAKMDNAAGGENANYVIYVERKGVIPVPVHLEIEYTDGSKERIHKTAEVWKNLDKRVFQTPLFSGKTPKKVILGGKTIPDAKPADNYWSGK
ncbi:MAG: M1 family metallopeptidase [Saprospiraceae bacterium]|nr:M1 family metallopeptidase [Saprospiraceae bacterium]